MSNFSSPDVSLGVNFYKKVKNSFPNLYDTCSIFQYLHRESKRSFIKELARVQLSWQDLSPHCVDDKQITSPDRQTNRRSAALLMQGHKSPFPCEKVQGLLSFHLLLLTLDLVGLDCADLGKTEVTEDFDLDASCLYVFFMYGIRMEGKSVAIQA